MWLFQSIGGKEKGKWEGRGKRKNPSDMEVMRLFLSGVMSPEEDLHKKQEERACTRGCNQAELRAPLRKGGEAVNGSGKL